MNQFNVRREDQILMSLVHYFVTKENYTPILVQGVKDEIWLQKLDGPYRVIRINSNYIHNEEQFKFDQYKIKDILKQIKKKTMSFTVNALNINLNMSERCREEGLKNIDNIHINALEEITSNEIIKEVFPNMNGNLYTEKNGLDLILNVTNDINSKTERENKKYEKIFAVKKIYVTYVLIAICIGLYLLFGANENFLTKFACFSYFVKNGEVYRFITYAFLHGSLWHLIVNMYSLYVIGKEVESKFGITRFLLIYLISALGGGMLSAGLQDAWSVGASGAIFGLLGAMLYFGYRFRLYLKDSLRNSIVPIIFLNLIMGFLVSGIDNACHIGGLICGYLAAMAFGIGEDSNKKDKLNGKLMLVIFLLFLSYLVFIY